MIELGQLAATGRPPGRPFQALQGFCPAGPFAGPWGRRLFGRV
jgi:hypothetical protein